MPRFSDLPRSEVGLDHLRRLVILRWWTIAGQVAAIAFAHWAVGVYLDLAPMLLVIALLAIFNGVATLRLTQAAQVSPRELFAQLCVDLSALTVLLFFSGGAANPLASLFLLPIAFAAVILPAALAWTTAILGLALYSVLAVFRVPISVVDYVRANALALFGTWFTFAILTLLIAWFLLQMTASIRQRDRELGQAREQALRNERIVALGSLAAGAAHELGTPLNTLAVLVDELLQEPALRPEHRQSLAIMKDQVARCKTTLTSLAARAGEARAEGGRRLALDDWLRGLLAAWQKSPGAVPLELTLQGPQPAPVVVSETTLEQALRNLLDNAAQASRKPVRCYCTWSEDVLDLLVQDLGPGFPPEVLEAAGRNVLNTKHQGSGIGLYLAFSAIERHGGSLRLANRTEGGAQARVLLPLDKLKAAPQEGASKEEPSKDGTGESGA